MLKYTIDAQTGKMTIEELPDEPFHDVQIQPTPDEVMQDLIALLVDQGVITNV